MKTIFIIIFSFIFYTNNLFCENLSEKKAGKVEKKLATQLATKYNIQFLLKGAGCLVDSKRQPTAFSFASQIPLNINDARTLTLNLAYELLLGFQSDPVLKEYHNETHKVWNKMTKAEITYDAIGFKITYWDENINRFIYPYIAQVKFVDEKILYYYADPKTQALLEPIVETHEEAYKRAFGK